MPSTRRVTSPRSLFYDVFLRASNRTCCLLVLIGLTTMPSLYSAPVQARTARTPGLTQVLDLTPHQMGEDATSSTLNESVDLLVRFALEHHPAIAAEKAQRDSRQAGIREARAAYQPEVTVSASLARQDSEASDIPGTARSQTEREGLMLRQNIWRGGRDATQITAAEADAGIATFNTSSKIQDITLNVREACLRLNQAALSESLANEAAKDAAEVTQLSERKFAAGQAGKIDIHQAGLRESEARAQAAKARMTTHDASFALLSSLGLESSPPGDLTAAITSLQEEPLPLPLAPEMKQTKPAPLFSVQAADLTAEKASLTRSLARKERWLPSLDFVASWNRDVTTGRVDPGVVQIGGSRDRNAMRLRTNLGLELNWTLWNGIRDERILRAAADEAAARARALDAAYSGHLARETLSQQIQDLYQIIPPYKAAYQAAVRLYEAQRQLYEAGATSVFAVTEADSRRLSTLREWLDAAYQIKLAVLKWNAMEQGYMRGSS